MSERKCPPDFIWDDALGSCVRKWDDSIINAEVNNGGNNTTTGAGQEPKPEARPNQQQEAGRKRRGKRVITEEEWRRGLEELLNNYDRIMGRSQAKPEAKPEEKPHSNPLVEAAKQLVGFGFNVIFVDRDKRPVGIEKYADYYTQKMQPEAFKEHVKKAAKATGIALLGNYNPDYPNKALVIIDVDDPKVWQEKVLPNLPENVKQKLETTWRWLTGPRCPVDGDKHNITCKDGKCRHSDHEFNVKDAPRGMAYAVLAPASDMTDGTKKLMGGAVELRIRGYELIPPSLHPSGINYEWVNPAITNGVLQPIAELTNDEFKALLNALGDGQAQTPQPIQPVQAQAPQAPVKKTRCAVWRRLKPDRIDKAIEVVKELYVPGNRDNILFGIASLLRRECVHYEDARKLFEKIIGWAKAQYPDEDEKKDYYTLDWVYGVAGGEDKRIWGRRKFLEVITEAVKAVKQVSNDRDAKALAFDWINKLIKALGLTPAVKVRTLISERGRLGGWRAYVYVVNDPLRGVTIEYRIPASMTRVKSLLREMCRAEGRDDVDACVSEKLNDKALVHRLRWGVNKPRRDYIIKDWYISRVVIIRDPLTRNTYYTVEFTNVSDGRRRKIAYRTIEELIMLIARKLGAKVSGQQLLGYLFDLIEKLGVRKTHPALTGIALVGGKPRLLAYGPHARYMRELLNAQGDPKAFVELLEKWYNNDPKVWDAFALGLFQAFNFLRKQATASYVSRNKFELLVGQPNTGKSTIAKIIVIGIYNHEPLVQGPDLLYSPARLARAAAFSTLPLLINDVQKFYADRIADMIKNLVTDYGPVYNVAVPYSREMITYIGATGLIITAQKFIANDIGVLDRTREILFTTKDVKDPDRDEARINEFNKWLAQHRADLMAFGRLYLETAVNEWDNVKGIVLNPNYEEAARQYLAYVVRKLGAEPVYPSEEATSGAKEEERYWYIDQFVRALKNIALKYNWVLPRSGSYDAVETIRKTALKGYIEGIEVKPAGFGYSMFIIRRSFIRNEGLEVQNLAQLYEGLRAELAEYLPEDLQCLLDERYINYDRDKYGYYIAIDERLIAVLLGIKVVCRDEGPTIPSHESSDEENNE